MSNKPTVRVRYSDIENAFTFVSMSAPEENSAIIDMETGAIYYRSDMVDDEEIPEELEESGNYVEIPHQNELDLGEALVRDFVRSQLPDRMYEVDQIFRRGGAYSRFKSLLASIGKLDAWHQYEDERSDEALKEWCKLNGIEIIEG